MDVDEKTIGVDAASASPTWRHSAPSSDKRISRGTNVVVRNTHKSKDDGLLKSFAHWLLQHQIIFSVNLVALLFLTHMFLPAARPHTSKFFTLSYHNANTGKYAAGSSDLHFMAFCIVVLTGLRASAMRYVLAPLAQHWGVSRKKDATRFAEQSWAVLYYNIFWPMGMYLYYTSPYFLNMEQLWADWPQREISGLMKFYILSQWAFWTQQIIVINIEDRRKDHWQMLAHHVVTIALMAASYAYHQTRVGNLILLLTDAIDVILPVAKCLKYLGFTWICDIIFGLFVVAWLLSRHIFYMMACWSVHYDLPRMIPSACYRGPAEQLQGPFPTPENSWSYLLEPFRDPQGLVCFNEGITNGFLSFLLFLQVMMILWFTFIVRIVIGVLQGKPAEDVRSDAEEDEQVSDSAEEEDEPTSHNGHLERECSAEAIDWSGWERRRGDSAQVSGSSGFSFAGHRERKELLNRIGCEKQID